MFTNEKEGTKSERKILELVEGKVRKIFERMREELIFLREMNKRKERPSGYLYICVCVCAQRKPPYKCLFKAVKLSQVGHGFRAVVAK